MHNISVVFEREGREVATYRKIHLFDITTPDGTQYHESSTVKAGHSVVTYDIEGFRVGCAICFDMRCCGSRLVISGNSRWAMLEGRPTRTNPPSSEVPLWRLIMAL